MVDLYKPDDALLENTWLFDDWTPDVPAKADSIEDPMVPVDAARRDALVSIVNSHGIEGVVDFAKRVKLPQFVAVAARHLELPTDQLLKLLQLAVESGTDIDNFSGLVVAEGFSRFGSDFVDNVREIFIALNVESSRAARLLFTLDEDIRSWEVVKSFGQEVNEAYWAQKHPYFIKGDSRELLFAIENYASRGRPMAAVQASHNRMKEVPSSTLLGLLDAAVAEINASQGHGATMTIFYIERVFKELESRVDVTPEERAKREFAYLPCFTRRKEPLTLHRLVVEQPSLFMEAICAAFKPAGAEAKEVTDGERRLALAAYRLLDGLSVLPGQVGDDIDPDALLRWCSEVRRLAVEADRVALTDGQIGSLLAHAPLSSVDGAWPHEAVRTAIEAIASAKLEQGVAIERYNMRGVYSKAIGEGGEQERALAKQARDWAVAMPQFPRSAAMLMRIADGWSRAAEDADLQAAKDALRE